MEMRKKMGMEKEMERRWGGEVDGYGVWDGVGMEYRMEKGTEKGKEKGTEKGWRKGWRGGGDRNGDGEWGWR